MISNKEIERIATKIEYNTERKKKRIVVKNLNNLLNKPGITEKEKNILQRQKQYHIEEGKKFKEWVQNHKNDVDIEKYFKIWADISEENRDRFLSLLVRSFASIEGAASANDAIKFGLKMEQAGINIEELSVFTTKLFRIEAVRILLSNSDIHTRNKQQIMEAICDREFPSRRPTNKDESEKLRKLISNEIERYVDNLEGD